METHGLGGPAPAVGGNHGRDVVVGYAFTSGIRRPWHATSGADCTGIDKPTPVPPLCPFFSRIQRVGMAVTSQFIDGTHAVRFHP